MTDHHRDPDRDPVVARALRELPVSDHAPGFWAELDARLAGEERGPAAPPAPPDHRVATGALPAVSELQPDPGPPRRHRVPFLAAAAVLLVAALATGVVLAGDGGDIGDVEQAASTTLALPASSAATTAGEPDEPGPPPTPTTAPEPLPPGSATPEDAVLAWLTALGEGDAEAAVTHLGPLTLRYLDSLGADPVGFMEESQEGYGAWTASPDLATREVAVPGAGVVVVVSGTWMGEGTREHRSDAIPTVQRGDGAWLVEHLAFSPATGGRPEIVTPEPTPEGWTRQQPDVVVEARSADPGVTFWFALDDGAAVMDGDGVWDPPGELDSGSHRLVVAVVGDGIFGALAGTFTVG